MRAVAQTMTIYRVLAAALVALGLFVVLVNPADAQSAPVVIRFGIQPNILPEEIVRAQKSLEKAYGGKYKMEWVPVNFAGPAIAALAAGSLDMTDAGVLPLIQARARGVKFWDVADAVGDVTGLVVRKGTGIRSPADLKGKTIAYPGAGSWQQGILQLALDGTGVSLSDIHLYRAGFQDMPILLEKKAIDGFSGAEPFMSMVLSRGDARLLFRPAWRLKQKEGTLISGAVVARVEFAKEHPDAVRAFLKVFQEASRFIREHPREAGDTYAKLFPGVVSENVFLYAINHGLVYLNDVKPRYEDWVKFVNFTNKAGLTQISDPATFVKEYVHPEYVE